MCLFIKQFLSNPNSIGAVHPSSDELADLITETAKLKNRSTIVEIGSGTGVFTEKIHEKKNESADFFAIELNPYFVEQTKKRCPYVKVFKGSAKNINIYLKDQGFSGCDCIISGLPWASFNNEISPLLDGPISIIEIRGKRSIPADKHNAKLIAFDNTDLPEPGRANTKSIHVVCCVEPG